VAGQRAGAADDPVEEPGGERARRLGGMPWPPRARRKPGTTAATRRVLIRFVVASLVVELVLGLGGVVAGRQAAKDESISDARRVTNVLAGSVVTPNLTDGLLHSDPEAVRQLDRVIVGRVTGREVVRVKLWLAQPGGLFQVVYSDEHRLIGTVYQLADEEEEALLQDRTDADLSDASRPENRVRAWPGQAAGGLPPGPHAQRHHAAVRDLRPVQRGDRPRRPDLARVHSDHPRRAAAAPAGPAPIGLVDGAAAGRHAARARPAGRAGGRGIGDGAAADRR
jgi:hypothetical protein